MNLFVSSFQSSVTVENYYTTSPEAYLTSRNLSYTSLHGPVTDGTTVTKDYLSTLGYIWDNHTPTFSVLRLYDKIRGYENDYHKSSDELLKKWRQGTLGARDSRINDWLMSFLQIKEFIKE